MEELFFMIELFTLKNLIEQLYYKVPRYTGKLGMPALPRQAVGYWGYEAVEFISYSNSPIILPF